MQFQLFLFFFFSFHQFFIITNALFNYDPNNSSVNINLYQCDTNQTIVNSTIIITDIIFNSCDLNCCTTNDTNQTIYSNICQVTVQSFTGVCLGRLCYSGECDQFLSITNMTYYQKMENNTTIMNKIHSSFSSIHLFSFVNSTQTKWTLWIDKSKSSIRYSILILLLIINIYLTLMTVFFVIKSIRHAKMIADKKSHRYSLF